MYANLLNTAEHFGDVYRLRPGHLRRRALLAMFERYPDAKLPVNNHYQANLIDPDLALLLKRGLLVRTREGGGRRHPMNRTSAKRQTYLKLAPLGAAQQERKPL